MAHSDHSPDLRPLLVRELARRLLWGGLSYALFAALFTPQLTAGRNVAWVMTGVLAGLGVARTLYCRSVIRSTETTVARGGNRLVAVAAVQSIVFGAFVISAFWHVRGMTVPECLLMIAIAALSSTSASLFAPLPGLASMHMLGQLAPAYVWAIWALPRYGWMLGGFVTIHFVSIIQLVRMTSGHLREMFRAQMALEKQSADLGQARDAAEQASSARMTFLANMSHEIRTPLNGVIGLAQVLEETALSDDQRATLGDLSRSGEQLLSVVNDILDIAKVSSGKLVLENVRFRLPDLIRDVTAPAAVLAESKRLEFHVDSAGLPVEVEGDPVRIRQIISNLLSNAVKFTQSGEVRLAASAPRRGWVRIEVSDTGIGLSPEQTGGLFEDFHQVDSSTTRRFGGTGLGLAICRRLVDLMGGRIEVESRQGHGSRFWFEIPLAAADGEVEQPHESGRAGVLPEGTRVLVAEDNAVNRRVIERLVGRAGVEVDVAENGRIALELHRETPYDIILMDCQMPEMDGYEATALIRALPGSRSETPILGVTASAFKEDGERCRRAGMDGHVSKPVSREVLLRAMADVLAERSAKRV